MCEKYAKIILCKGKADENSKESYQSIIEKAGYVCEILQVLNFEYSNLDELQNCLINFRQYSGCIFTSQRSIEAIELIQKKEVLKDWENLPAYCVGPATASLAKNHLNLQHILGEDCGNAEKLAYFIVKNSTTKLLPLLYPCSEIARESITKILIDNQINFKKLVVYKTLPSKNLVMDFEKIIEPSVKCLVLFSPSIVECVIPLLYKNKHLLQSVKLVAIGEITNNALSKLGIKAAAVSLKPEPEALLSAIKSCI